MSRSADPNSSAGLIDLHSHTTESDGTLTPAELVALAKRTGLSAFSITDHDTFAGYEKAVPLALESGVQLVRGIELNSRLIFPGDPHQRHVHVLAYFPDNAPSAGFTNWLGEGQEDRRQRNRRLVSVLRERGLDITLEEVEARGRSMAGRPHFARLLVEKGYAADYSEAFHRFIGEEAPTYVERQSRTTEETIRIIREGGGIPSVAHPVRLSLPHDTERDVLVRLKEAGLLGLEVYHSEHPPHLQAHYRRLAEELDLCPTGGSDFHGSAKADVKLGTGFRNNLRIPLELLDRIKTRCAAQP